MGMPEPQILPLPAADRASMIDVDQWAFAVDLHDYDVEPTMATMEWDRTFGAHVDDGDGPALAGVNSTYSVQLPVPGGGQVPCGGLTWVGVHPQFRRRGILRTMIGHHLGAVRERGEPVSALHASEATIYGRFGYGTGSRHLRLKLSRGAELRDVPGSDAVRIRFETADVERHAALVDDCYEAARGTRPGMVSRPGEAHRRRMLEDQPVTRRGAEPLRLLVAEADGEGPVRGYALFRRKGDWDGPSPAGKVWVRELVARDPAAGHALWSRLLDLDLTATVEPDERPLDDPLLANLVDVRAAGVTVVDGLYVRLVDVPAALAARRYAAELDVVLELTDELCPWNAGRWRLEGGPDGAACTRSDRTPDVRLDVRELGSLYLGADRLTALAAAGRLQVTDGPAGDRAATALGWPVAPYCGWMF